MAQKNVRFALFRTYTPDEQQISVVSLVDNMEEFHGTLKEFCEKYDRKYDDVFVYDPRERNGVIAIELTDEEEGF